MNDHYINLGVRAIYRKALAKVIVFPQHETPTEELLRLCLYYEAPVFEVCEKVYLINDNYAKMAKRARAEYMCARLGV